MMRVLILGGAGMLGHKLYQTLRTRFDVRTTLRGTYRSYAELGIFEREEVVERIDAVNFDSIVDAFAKTKPDAVVNCIGVVKQLAEAKDPIASLTLNSLFPHRLQRLCAASGSRLIHISTDCVFSGRRGGYTETDISDAEDLYGRSKFLGEVTESPALTLRTSIIGRELGSQTGLVEWFLSNRGGRVRGFEKAVFSGVTTRALSELIATILSDHPGLTGLYQVAAEPVNKYDLLLLLRDVLGVEVGIDRDAGLVIDRSLSAKKFFDATRLTPPSWSAMIQEMRDDPTPYDRWEVRRAS
jgi:dTDP-4-dehydrorhamnose reductase